MGDLARSGVFGGSARHEGNAGILLILRGFGLFAGAPRRFAATPNCVEMRRPALGAGFKNYAVRCPFG
jgi:hypothetical protein